MEASIRRREEDLQQTVADPNEITEHRDTDFHQTEVKPEYQDRLLLFSSASSLYHIFSVR
jgi:hypothetical protein